MTDHLTDLESIADEIVARGEQQQQQTSTAMELSLIHI